MTCYHPMIRTEYWSLPKKRAEDGHYYYKATVQPASDLTDDRPEQIRLRSDQKLIPCGKCIGCRLEYAKEWANRGYLESKLHKENWFITLTYNDENLPKNGSLEPEELQKFFKRLRRQLEPQKISYLSCGEYGELNERPHYHIILFGAHLDPKTFYKARIINKETYWQNKIIEKCWRKGISNISEASWNTINYTARYITKKINGPESDEHYKGKEKEFMRVSKAPAIGRNYYELYKDKLYKEDKIIIKTKKGSIEQKLPKYFDKLYEKEHPEEFKKIKLKRNRKSYESQKYKDTTTALSRLEQLEIEELTTARKSSGLIRAMEKTKKCG